MRIPSTLEWLRTHNGGSAWLAALPDILDAVCHAWNVRVVGEPFAGSFVSYVVPAQRDGTSCVLKLQWPDAESEHEGAAIRVWDGQGAVRLIDEDPGWHALLLETCRPGTYLGNAKIEDPLAVIIDLLPCLWVPAGEPFRSLADAASGWAASLPEEWAAAGRPCERDLVDAALEFIDRLACTQGEQVLLHQDLHGHNVLAAEREPWLVIDPKPLVGERAFSLAPVVRSRELGDTERDTVGRLYRLSAELGLDRDRALGWTVAQTMA